jgi:hypothetical protein
MLLYLPLHACFPWIIYIHDLTNKLEKLLLGSIVSNGLPSSAGHRGKVYELTGHAVNFISYGNYDKKTGLKEKDHPET